MDALVEEAKRLQPDKTRFTAEQVLALAARLEAAERRLRDAEVLLDYYNRTSSLDPGNNRRMVALRRRFLRAEEASDAGA